MKTLLRDKLNKMKDVEERRLLKDIVWGIFDKVVDYQDEMNKKLEKRVFDEIQDSEENYNIYSTVIKRDDLRLVNEFFFPILEEDKREEKYDKKKLIESFKNGDSVKITKVFLDKSYSELKSLEREKELFGGEIITSDRVYGVKVKLVPNYDYLNQLKKLYKIFLDNGVKWRTVNNPYIYRMYDLHIVGYEDDLSEIEDFEEIKFNLGEYEDNKYIGYIPVWNIEVMDVKGEGFPLPADDKVNYDHLISLNNISLANGYLISPENENLVSVKRREMDLIITSDRSNALPWEIWKIVQENKPTKEEYEFEVEITSNKRKVSFVNKFSSQQASMIKTFADVNRLVNSFEGIDSFQLQDVKIISSNAFSREGEGTYDCNSFIKDQIRDKSLKKIMLLEFSHTGQGYLADDYLSFVVSEVQMYFPEYLCKGVYA